MIPMGIFWLTLARIRRRLRRVVDSSVVLAHGLRFHLFFKNKPAAGEYCNSRRIHLGKRPIGDEPHRAYLAIIRCGAKHCVIDDGNQRTFDIALNLYACPDDERLLDRCEYWYSGGINKYKAAYQLIDGKLLHKYRDLYFSTMISRSPTHTSVSSWNTARLTRLGWHNPA